MPESPFHYRIDNLAGIVIFRFEGVMRFDTTEFELIADVGRALDELAKTENRRLLVDVTEVVAVYSVSVGSIFPAFFKAHHDHDFQVAVLTGEAPGHSPRGRRLTHKRLRMIALDKILPIFTDENEAMEHLRSNPSKRVKETP